VVALVVKFHFSNSQLREQPFATNDLTRKYQNSKSRGPRPHATHFQRTCIQEGSVFQSGPNIFQITM